MVTNLEVKEITQRAQQLLLFRLQPVQDETQRGLPINLIGVAVTSGPQVYQPTLRLTVKRKLDDPVEFAMIRKVIPPYPDNTARAGVAYQDPSGTRFQVSGGILYQDNQPWWYWYSKAWPMSYAYSSSTPPTNWNPLGQASLGIPFTWQAFDLSDGEMGFLLSQIESYWPAGSYYGWVEYWPQGDGTVPDDPPELVVPFTLRINRRPQTTLAV
jgi:hypothetical protein